MKRAIIVLLASSFAIFGIAGTGSTSIKGGGTFKDGPYTATTPDSGTCGNNWAQDLFVRNFTVKLPAVDGVYTVTEKFGKGRFSTYAGPSPASCDTGPGDQITEGVAGKFSGTLTLSVGGTFNDGGACVKTSYGGDSGWMQCDTAGWVKGFFGVDTYSVDQFHFDYQTSAEGLLYHHWINDDAGNVGDIASS